MFDVKWILLFFPFFISRLVAADIRTYSKLNSKQAIVVIQTDLTNNPQATLFLDSKENEKFILDLYKDPNSDLFRLKEEVLKENCGEFEYFVRNSTLSIPGCGSVTMTNSVMTAYGKEGWESGGASYSFFVGFTSEGAGRFFNTSRLVIFSETVEAQTQDDGKYSGMILKTLSLEKIINLDNTP